MCAWYNNLKLNSIEGFNDLYNNMLIKKKVIELFSVAQQEGDTTRVHLKSFNEEMLNVEKLIKPTNLETLIKGV